MYKRRACVSAYTVTSLWCRQLFMTFMYLYFVAMFATSKKARSWWRRSPWRASCVRRRSTPTRITTLPVRQLLVITTERWHASCRRNAGAAESRTRRNPSLSRWHRNNIKWNRKNKNDRWCVKLSIYWGAIHRATHRHRSLYVMDVQFAVDTEIHEDSRIDPTIWMNSTDSYTLWRL